MKNEYYLKQRLLGVALILLCVFVGLFSDMDMTIGIIGVPLGLVLIVSKERLLDNDYWTDRIL